MWNNCLGSVRFCSAVGIARWGDVAVSGVEAGCVCGASWLLHVRFRHRDTAKCTSSSKARPQEGLGEEMLDTGLLLVVFHPEVISRREICDVVLRPGKKPLHHAPAQVTRASWKYRPSYG